MIISKGKDDFINNRFDKFRWSANTYETAEEILACFHVLGIYGKRIKGVSAIGAMPGYSLAEWQTKALCALNGVGIVKDYDIMDEWVEMYDGNRVKMDDCLNLMKNVPMKRSVILEEPFLVLFEDGNVLELLPCAPMGLRIGYNTLPKNMRDGVNRCEFDVGVLFNGYLSDAKFSGLKKIISATNTTTYDGPRDSKTTKRNQYYLSFFTCTVVLRELQCSEFTVSFYHDKTITCGEVAEIQKRSFQPGILEGRRDGGAYCIYPVTGTEKDKQPWDTDLPEMISVYHQPNLFRTLLIKSFDPELPVNRERSQGHYDDYYSNYYTKGTILQIIEEMLADLEQVRWMPADEQSKRLSCRFCGDTEEDLLLRIKEEIEFTARFAERLRGLVLNTPGQDYICVDGP